MRPPRSLRYLVVAGICALTHNVVMVVADAMGLGLVAAAGCSFALVVLIGYGLHAAFTFETAPGLRSFFSYVAVMALNLPVALATLWLFAIWMDLPMILAAPASTVAALALNYLGSAWSFGLRLAGPTGAAGRGSGTEP